MSPGMIPKYSNNPLAAVTLLMLQCLMMFNRASSQHTSDTKLNQQTINFNYHVSPVCFVSSSRHWRDN